MATSTQFAYNNSDLIPGTIQVGNLAVGAPTSGFTSSPQFWSGPDQDLGYVIAIPVSGNTQPTPISGVTASVGFYGTGNFVENDFIGLSQYVSNEFGNPQTFTTGNQASAWLTNNGFWNSWVGVSNNIVIEGVYFPGSVNASYTATASYPLDVDMTVNFQNTLGTISGSPLVLGGSVKILAGSTTGNEQLTVNYNYNNLTDESSFGDVSFDITGTTEYGFTVEASSGTTFDVTPTPTPSVTPPVTPSVTTTNTPTPTNTMTPTKTSTPSVTPSVTRTQTPTNTASNTPTRTVTPTVTKTPTNTQTPTKTPTNTPSVTPSKPAGLVAGVTIYLNPSNFVGASGSYITSTATLNDSSGNNYNASIVPTNSTNIQYFNTGGISYFQYNGTLATYNAGTSMGKISIPSFPTLNNNSGTAIGRTSGGVITNSFTTSNWFWTNGSDYTMGGANIGLFQKLLVYDFRTGLDGQGAQVRVGNGTNLRIIDAYVGQTSPMLWTANTWNNLTISVSGTSAGVIQAKVYVNGLLFTGLTPTTANQTIGSGGGNTTLFWVGDNSVFRYTTRYGQMYLYSSTALTDQQVLANYNFQKTSYGL